jgi:hypothetical protein
LEGFLDGATTAPGAILVGGAAVLDEAAAGDDKIGRSIVATGFPRRSVTGIALGAELWAFRG